MVFWQFFLPQHLISRAAGKLANSRWIWLKNTLIKAFIKRYKVNMSEAAIEDYRAYPTFNQFFTRELKPDARPLVSHPNVAVCPADGVVSQAGKIKQGRMFQAKGHYFNLVELLGGSQAKSLPFWNGSYATIYLAPKDYHRVHMPFAGQLEEMVYIPGRLFSVNPATTQAIPRLFARNERMVAFFSTAIGEMAVIMVGAIIVASIETSWGGLISPARQREIQTIRYTNENIFLNKGDELGKFQVGSTAIVLFANNEIRWAENIAAANSVLMGSRFAYF